MADDDDSGIPGELIGPKEPDYKAPESRLTDADDGRKLGVRLEKEDEQRGIQRALVRGNLDGNPPWRTKEAGKSWEANVNFMFGKARVNRALSTYSALFAGVENYADIVTGFQLGNPERIRWNEILSVEFHNLIKTWSKGFDWNMQHRIKQMLVEGYAPVLMEEGDNWRFKALDSSCIKVPRGTPSCLDERCPYIVLLDSMSVLELWDKIRNASSKERGWNEAAVKWAIRNSKRAGASQPDSWEQWQQRLQQHDLEASAAQEQVKVYHLFVKEFKKSGEKLISHFICTQTDLSAPLPIEKDFLFKHVRCYENYEQCLHVFFSNIGDGTWHSVRGLAFDSFKHDVMTNRMYCRLADRGFVDSTAFYESASQNQSDKMDGMIVGGAVVRLPAGAKIVQTGFSGNLAGVMDAIRLITNSVNGNTGASNPRTIMREDGKGEMPTLGQVRAQIQQDTQLSNDQIRLDYLAMDRLYTQQVKRAVRANTTDEQAKEFQQRCMDKGVPREALDNIESVTANRMSGYGSAAMKDATIDRIMQVVGMLNQEGRNNFLNYFIMSATENPGLVEYFNPPQQQLTQDDALIVLENSALKDGETPLVISGQNNVNHLVGHIEFLGKEVAPVREAIEMEQDADPQALEAAEQLVSITEPHILEHMELVENDPTQKQLAKQFKLQVAEITAFHGKLRQAVRSAIRQAEIAEQEEQNAMALGTLDQAKYDSQKLHDAMVLQKTQNKIFLDRMKATVATRIKGFNATQDNQRKTVTTLVDIGLKKAAAKNGASKE